MFVTLVLLLTTGAMQTSGPATRSTPFIGKWTTTAKSGPRTFSVESNGNKLLVTIDGQNKAIDGTLFVGSLQRPAEPVAITATTGTRLFIVRRQGSEMLLEMFSTFPDRPAVYWSERFTRQR